MPQFIKPDTINQVWASSGILTAPVNLKLSQGWTVEIPPYQYFNWSQNRIDSFMAHVNQFGITQWDNTTEYQGNKSYVSGKDGVVYKAKMTNVNSDPSDPLNRRNWVQAFETYGVVEPVQTQLNKLQTDYGTLANLTNYPQARQNLGVFSKSESDVRFAFKSGVSTQTFSVAFATEDSHAIPLAQLTLLIKPATTTNSGIARMATNIENEQGTLDNVIVSPVSGNATYLRKSQNLSDVQDKAAARQNLGLTTTATKPEEYFVRSLDLVAQVSQFARISAPNGWLVCDGRAVSRTTYSDLFDAIGTLYGAGDGSTTFNIPDCRKEFMRGWDGTTGSIGVKQEQSLMAHGHSAAATLGGAHSHTGSSAAAGGHVHAATAQSAGSHSHSASTSYDGNHSHSTTLLRDGARLEGYDNALYGDENRYGADTLGTSYAGAHSHIVNISSSGLHSHTVSLGTAGEHNHTITLEPGGAHSHDITIQPTGGAENRPRSIQFLTCIRY